MAENPPATDLRIVVGVDGSAHSRLAIRWAARLAPALGARIDAVIAWHYPVSAGMAFLPSDWDPEADALACLRNALRSALGDELPSDLREIALQGWPASVLLAECETATMLVVGSRGHGGFAGLLLGSVSNQCAEHARCPVLVVHADPAELELDHGDAG